MLTFEFSSVLTEEFRQDLEQLLYFNPLQRDVRFAIVRSIERYGVPVVRVHEGFLQVCLDATPGVQTLFAVAVDGDTCELAGLVVYRRAAEHISIIHLAVAEPFSAAGGRPTNTLALRLVLAVRGVARRLNGVLYLELPYERTRPRCVWAFRQRREPASHDRVADALEVSRIPVLIGSQAPNRAPVVLR